LANFSKLLSALAYPAATAAGATQVAPINRLHPTADADLTFGWEGNLFSHVSVGASIANTVGATVTIPDDGFYILDAQALAVEGTNTPGIYLRRAALDILDPLGNIIWRLVDPVYEQLITAVGAFVVTPPPHDNIRLHLKANMVVRYILLDQIIVTGSFVSSIALRKLYGETW